MQPDATQSVIRVRSILVELRTKRKNLFLVSSLSDIEVLKGLTEQLANFINDGNTSKIEWQDILSILCEEKSAVSY